ncbi:MAG: hypothetical protein IJM51_05225 [Clostridia bacterium]|nr:hypothetical protein [Clostridia bacterium]
MDKIIWMLIMIPTSAVFTGIGIFAWRRKKPMWFWAGSTVKESEIRDVPAYNRANGIMWLTYSAFFWASTLLGILDVGTAGIVMMIGCTAGIFALMLVYMKIYDYYKTK